MLSKVYTLLVLVSLLNKLIAIENNSTGSLTNNRSNVKNIRGSESGLVFTSLSFSHLSKYNLYMCTGSIKFETITDCGAFAGSQMRCAFSSQPMTVDHFKLYTNHIFTVSCPSTKVNVLSDDGDVKYFNCLTDTVYTIDMSKKYSEYECEIDDATGIVGIVFGCLTLVVIIISICCCCMVKKGGKAIVCNCQPATPILAAKNTPDGVVYSQPQPQQMPYIPPPNSNSNINNNNNNNTMSSGQQPQCMPYLVAQQLPDGSVQYYSTQPPGPNQQVLYSDQPHYPDQSKITPGVTVMNLPGAVNSKTVNNPNSDDEYEYPSCKVVLPGSTLARNPV